MSKFLIVITEPIHPAGVKLLKNVGMDVLQLPPGSNENTLQDSAKYADALITRGGIKITREFMSSSNTKVIGVHGIGCDHIDLIAAKELGKIVFNTPKALTASVAEMTLALMLSLTRRVVRADKAVRAGEWNRKYSDLRGIELVDKTIGIVGLGNIGLAVARRLKPFQVKLLYFSRTRKKDIEFDLKIKWTSFDDLIMKSDIITLHIPYTSKTHHLISDGELSKMKTCAFIVNTSRGKIIDQNALIKALKNGRVAGAALDVFEEEPLDQKNPIALMDNVILTPHLGASSDEAMKRMAFKVAEGVIKTLKGETPENRVI